MAMSSHRNINDEAAISPDDMRVDAGLATVSSSDPAAK
jgi:hypothetical protein